MFEPRKLRVIYRVFPEQGEAIELDLRLNEQGMLEGIPATGPEWTQVDDDRCTGCSSRCAYCRAALSIVPVVEAFMQMDSLQTVRTRATMNDRTVEVTGPVSKTVSSIMGLCMAASGCSTSKPFRAMATYHQPFATLEETVIRAASFTLLAHWAKGTLTDEDPFAHLIDAWAALEEANMRIGRRLQQYCENDATLNGLVNLDMFAKSGGLGLEMALAALKPVMLAQT